MRPALPAVVGVLGVRVHGHVLWLGPALAPHPPRRAARQLQGPREEQRLRKGSVNVRGAPVRARLCFFVVTQHTAQAFPSALAFGRLALGTSCSWRERVEHLVEPHLLRVAILVIHGHKVVTACPRRDRPQECAKPGEMFGDLAADECVEHRVVLVAARDADVLLPHPHPPKHPRPHPAQKRPARPTPKQQRRSSDTH